VLRPIVFVHVLATQAGWRLAEKVRRRGELGRESGQSTAEYALVLLGAAGVAVLFMTWASRTDRITRLLNGVLDRVMGMVS
jgi:hypothetical protein